MPIVNSRAVRTVSNQGRPAPERLLWTFWVVEQIGRPSASATTTFE